MCSFFIVQACRQVVGMSKWDKYYLDAEESSAPPPWEANAPYHGLKEFIESEKIEEGSRCIEFGSGSSASAVYMAESGHLVDAVDVCPWAIERAKKMPKADLVNWIQGDLLRKDLFETTLRPGSYDLVFDMQCFHCLREIDEAQAAKAIFTALKPGGYALVVVGAADPGYDDVRPNETPGPPKLRLEDLRGPVETAGLTTVQLWLSRLSPTPKYDIPEARNPLGLPPLAWVGLFQKILWDPAATYALEVQDPYSTHIVEGRKAIETRAYPLPPALLNQRILLVEPPRGVEGAPSLPAEVPAGSPHCRVVGSAVFTSCARYTSAEAWDADREKHLVPRVSVYDWKDSAMMTQPNDVRQFPTLDDGKITEWYGWQVGETHPAGSDGEVPKLQRVFRSLFRVVA